MQEEIIKLSNNLCLNYLNSKKQASTILFLHFSGGTCHMWNGVFPLFQEQYQLIAPDFRGHGKSDRPNEGYHIEDMANDIYLLLNELSISNCHIIGSSLGAEVGVCLASMHPGLVLSLTCEGAIYNEFGEYGLFNGSVEEIENEKLKFKLLLKERKLKNYSSIEKFILEQKVFFEEQGVWNPHVFKFVSSLAEKQQDGTYVSHYKNKVRTEYIQKYWDVKFEEYFKKVKCPILFMPSEEECNNDKIKKSLSYFQSLVPFHETIRIAGSIHAYVWMQKPEESGNAALRFIENNAQEKI